RGRWPPTIERKIPRRLPRAAWGDEHQQPCRTRLTSGALAPLTATCPTQCPAPYSEVFGVEARNSPERRGFRRSGLAICCLRARLDAEVLEGAGLKLGGGSQAGERGRALPDAD